MKVVTTQDLIDNVKAAFWQKAVLNADVGAMAEFEALSALASPTKEDVDTATKDASLTTLTCIECGQAVASVIEFRGASRVCLTCLEAAVAALKA